MVHRGPPSGLGIGTACQVSPSFPLQNAKAMPQAKQRGPRGISPLCRNLSRPLTGEKSPNTRAAPPRSAACIRAAQLPTVANFTTNPARSVPRAPGWDRQNRAPASCFLFISYIFNRSDPSAQRSRAVRIGCPTRSKPWLARLLLSQSKYTSGAADAGSGAL
jgi:hypothetical protein